MWTTRSEALPPPFLTMASMEPHPKVWLQLSSPKGERLFSSASTEPHPQVRLQQRLQSSSPISIQASTEPHPQVRLQPRSCLPCSSRPLLQRSHTRRCGYNFNSVGMRTPFPELQRSHTRRWRLCSKRPKNNVKPETFILQRLTCP